MRCSRYGGIDNILVGYHPFRWRKASCTFSSQSSDTMHSPTSAVSRLLSAFSAAFTLRFIRCAASCQIFPLRMREARFLISFHVPLLIQSFPGAPVGLGPMHLTASASKRAVFGSFGPGGRDSGNFWRARRYFFSRPVLPTQMFATTARWSEWRYRGDLNPTPLKFAKSPARAIK